MGKMAELMTEIIDQVAEGMDSSPSERQALEQQLMDDPAEFAMNYRDILTAEQIDALGGPPASEAEGNEE